MLNLKPGARFKSAVCSTEVMVVKGSGEVGPCCGGALLRRAAVFLASELSGWINGTTVHVDGGGLAAGGFQRIPSGDWTIIPEVTDKGTN
jgi:hypothetical protein